MRVNFVQAARKEQGNCDSCGKPIEIGQAYKWIKFRYGGARKRHGDCPNFRPSDMTQAKYGQVYAAIEDAEDSLDALGTVESTDDIRQILDDCSQVARDTGEEYEESASNMEQAFQGGSYKIDEIRESAEACETFASELDDACGGADEWDEDQARQDVLDELGPDETLEENEILAAVQEKREEWSDALLDEAREALGNFQL